MYRSTSPQGISFCHARYSAQVGLISRWHAVQVDEEDFKDWDIFCRMLLFAHAPSLLRFCIDSPDALARADSIGTIGTSRTVYTSCLHAPANYAIQACNVGVSAPPRTIRTRLCSTTFLRRLRWPSLRKRRSERSPLIPRQHLREPSMIVCDQLFDEGKSSLGCHSRRLTLAS